MRPRSVSAAPAGIAAHVVRLRNLLGQSQQEFAQTLCTSITTIARYETSRSPGELALLKFQLLADTVLDQDPTDAEAAFLSEFFYSALVAECPFWNPTNRVSLVGEGMVRLDFLRELQPGWDSYRAKAIDERAIAVAESILSHRGQATPLNSGGVQIEWHCGGVDVEFSIRPDGTIEECA